MFRFVFLLLILTQILSAKELIGPDVWNRSLPPVSNAERDKEISRFDAALFRGSSGEVLRYRLLAPRESVDGQKYPLVIALHGSNAIGTDNVEQLGGFIRSWADLGVSARFPAFVLAPQFSQRSANYAPSTQDAILASSGGPELNTLLELIDELVRTHPVDRERIYLTGFSMGASAGGQLLLLRPHFFAGAVLVSGIAPERSAAPALGYVPLMLIHGNADNENPIDSDRALVKVLGEHQTTKLCFREYDGMDHRVPADLLDRSAAGDEWRQWLFAQRAASPGSISERQVK